MMRTILVPLGPGLSSQPALDAALTLAKCLKSHIRAVFVRPDPSVAISPMPSAIATTEMRQAIERESSNEAATESVAFEDWRSRNGIPAMSVDYSLDTCFATWLEKVGEIERVVTHFGRVSDLIVLNRFLPGNIQAQRCFDAALFGTGRPTLLVPEKPPGDLIDHVLIAWNGSREASQAVFGVLPLLHAAARVSILSVPTPQNNGVTGDELAEALSWQGIQAHEAIRPSAPSSIGAALLDTATKSNATLIVMGAYTHSRLRQSFLGGVTMHVLSEATIPVVMSH
jgi:nucleotide-binding universal stress UspA family protein